MADNEATVIHSPRIAECLDSIEEWCASQETDLARAAAAKWAMDYMGKVVVYTSHVRIKAVRGLWATGWSLQEISEALGLSRARVHQIIEK